MAHGKNVEKNGRPGRELWGARPLAGWVKTAANKLLARRLERHAAKRATLAQGGRDGHE